MTFLMWCNQYILDLDKEHQTSDPGLVIKLTGLPIAMKDTIIVKDT